MTSVATQTDWSWLKDLEEIAKLTREHAAEVGPNQELQEEWNSRNLSLNSGGGATSENDDDKDIGMNLRSQDLKCRENLKQRREKEEKTKMSGNEKVNEKTLILPSIDGTVNSKREEQSKKEQNAEELVLPPIVSATSQAAEIEKEVSDDTFVTESMKATSLSSIEQLEHLTFPFFEDQTSEDSDGDTEEASNKTDDDERDSSRSSSPIPDAPRLKLDNLPWPSILQYMRESESLTSDYFSLSNKEAIESRLAQNKRLQQTVTLEEAERLKNRHVVSDDGDKSDSESEGELMAAKGQNCDFCGQSFTQISLLQLAEDQESQMALCCEERKEFCVLMAVCMRQMITRLKQQRPKKIFVELTKKAVKKTAEEKALAMMRRQRKWEELRRRKEEVQQTKYLLPKHTQLIQFSLLSAPEGEWMVRPESAMKHQTPMQKQEAQRREAALKKKEQEHLQKGVLLPKTIERLKQLQCEQKPCELKVLNYGDGKKFAILLPDGTGQVYYPSGNQAIAIFSPYIGVLAYLVFEDSSQPCLLAYMDELGRITCYSSQANIRLLLRPCEGFLYDGKGCQSCRKHWRWSSRDESLVFQPFTLSLNKQLTVKLNNQEKFLLTFCGSKQNHIRFDVESKLKDDVMLSRESETIQLAQSHLGMVKNRVSQLLQLLKQTSRPNLPRKYSVTEGVSLRSDWQSIYSTKTLVHRGDRICINEMTGRRRTKSTGGLTLQNKIKPLV